MDPLLKAILDVTHDGAELTMTMPNERIVHVVLLNKDKSRSITKVHSIRELTRANASPIVFVDKLYQQRQQLDFATDLDRATDPERIGTKTTPR